MRQLDLMGESQSRKSWSVPIEKSESLVPGDTIVCTKAVQGCKQGMQYAVTFRVSPEPDRDLMHDRALRVKEENILSCFEKCAGRVCEDQLFTGLYVVATVDGTNYKRGQRYQVITVGSTCKLALQLEPIGTGTGGSIRVPKGEIATNFRYN